MGPTTPFLRFFLSLSLVPPVDACGASSSSSSFFVHLQSPDLSRSIHPSRSNLASVLAADELRSVKKDDFFFFAPNNRWRRPKRPSDADELRTPQSSCMLYSAAHELPPSNLKAQPFRLCKCRQQERERQIKRGIRQARRREPPSSPIPAPAMLFAMTIGICSLAPISILRCRRTRTCGCPACMA